MSEGHAKRKKGGKTCDKTQSPLVILFKTNYSRVNIFELKSPKVQINGCVCVWAQQLFQPFKVSQDTQREAKKRNERERRGVIENS